MEDASKIADRKDRLIERELVPRGVTDKAVLDAIRKVPREEFISPELRPKAYANVPLEIPSGQTISQPLIVGLMSQLAQVNPGDRVLEVGTGSGYQTAILVELGAEVYSIERIEGLGQSAKKSLSRLGYNQVHLKIGDGYLGWPEAAPFSAIVVTAAPPIVPEALRVQLKEGGRLVIPVGEAGHQVLEVHRRVGGEFIREHHGNVSFVPMKTGILNL